MINIAYAMQFVASGFDSGSARLATWSITQTTSSGYGFEGQPQPSSARVCATISIEIQVSDLVYDRLQSLHKWLDSMGRSRYIFKNYFNKRMRIL